MPPGRDVGCEGTAANNGILLAVVVLRNAPATCVEMELASGGERLSERPCLFPFSSHCCPLGPPGATAARCCHCCHCSLRPPRPAAVAVRHLLRCVASWLAKSARAL